LRSQLYSEHINLGYHKKEVDYHCQSPSILKKYGREKNADNFRSEAGDGLHNFLFNGLLQWIRGADF